jgi:hypothetical protein
VAACGFRYLASGFESYDLPRCGSTLAMLSAFALRDSLLKPILAGGAKPFDAACTRRVSAARLAPTLNEVVTEFQSDSSRTDSAVRILYAQPRSRLKPEVRKRKTPSRGLRAASHSWPYACARRPSAARAAPAGRPLLHDRSVLRQARIADRICRRSPVLPVV